MKTTGPLTWIVLVASAFAFSAQDDPSFVPFGPAAYRLVNSIAFSPDDGMMYFALLYREVLAHRGVSRDSAPVTALFQARRTSTGWTEPELLPFSGEFQDYEPTLTADGTLMVFNSRRTYPDGRVPTVNDLWMTERTSDGWGPPRRIDAISTFENEESYATLTTDRTLVFLAGRPDASGQPTYDLYESRFVNGAFTTAARHPVSTDRWGEGDPWISPDGSYVIFTRWDDAVGWRETVDLHISFFIAGEWTPPSSLDELNTDGPDYGPAVSPDGRTLYYRVNSQFLRTDLATVVRRHRPGQ